MSLTAWWFSIGGAVAVVTFLMVIAELARQKAAGIGGSYRDFGFEIFMVFLTCAVGACGFPALLLMVAGWKVWDRSQASYHKDARAKKNAKAGLENEAASWDEKAKLSKDTPDIASAAKARAKDLRAQASNL